MLASNLIQQCFKIADSDEIKLPLTAMTYCLSLLQKCKKFVQLFDNDSDEKAITCESFPSNAEIVENINSFKDLSTGQLVTGLVGGTAAVGLGVATFFTGGLILPIIAIGVTAATAAGDKAFQVSKSVKLSREPTPMRPEDALAIVSITLSAVTLGTSGPVSAITQRAYNVVT